MPSGEGTGQRVYQRVVGGGHGVGRNGEWTGPWGGYSRADASILQMMRRHISANNLFDEV